jgi:hypothetical protein
VRRIIVGLLLTISLSFAMSQKQDKEVIKVVKNNNTQELEKIEGVNFYTEKPTYNKGENICFILENKSSNEILLPSSAPYAIFDKSKPEVAIFSPISTQVIITLKPNEKKQFCWNQKDTEGLEVPSGNYFARITFFDKNGKKYFLKSEFSIKLK